jgi:hypothetical protein
VGTVSENGKMSPRKTIVAIFITGIIIVASVGGFFFLADSNGLFDAEVRVDGYAQGTNASQCYLYVDGVKVATQLIGEGNYDYPYYNQDCAYSFDNIRVESYVEHKFQVITSNGEESPVRTEYTPFGQQSYLYINVIIEKTPVYVRGIYKSNNNGTATIHFYVDNQQISDYSAYSGGSYYFSTEVYANQIHSFKVNSYENNAYENETTQYIGTSATSIWLNLG